MGWDWFPFWGVFIALIQIAFWIGVVVLVIKLFQNREPRPPATRPALQLLEERYARGEISREEFAERRAVLQGGAPPANPAT